MLPVKKKTFHWEVLNPINNYGVNVNIGNYVNFSEKYKGKGGVLDVDYWVLPHQKDAALRQFKEVARTLEAFEHWFGKYPFYEDSYKLVTVSYPGMEHQSSVTYGNWFRNGYLQRDPCGCGVGFKFDFIIVHESAHEWFGNNISMKDAADMWIHEGFANYSENLFVEYHFGKKDAEDYVVGTRRSITKRPSDHWRLWDKQTRIRRHVSQRREHAAHHSPHHQRRREMALDPAWAQC